MRAPEDSLSIQIQIPENRRVTLILELHIMKAHNETAHNESQNVYLTEAEQVTCESDDERSLSLLEQSPTRDEISLTNFWNVVPETNSFKYIHSKIEKEKVGILGVSGKTGGGKSHIVGMLTDRFPSDAEKVNIPCTDPTSSVKEKLKELARSLIKDETKYQKVKKDIEEDSAGSLSEALQASKTNVLITVDNPDPSSHCLLKSLISNLNSLSSTCEKKIHLYISSREELKIFTTQSILYTVQGFSKDEAVKFLLTEGPVHSTVEGAGKVCDNFGTLPYVLQVIKSYCIQSKVSYEACLYKLESTLTHDERENSSFYETYRFNFPEFFNAITIPSEPIDDEEDISHLDWNILCCLSYLHNDNLPTDIIKQLIGVFRPEENDCEKATEELVQRLLKWNKCVKATKSDQETLTFYSAVLDAFRWRQQIQGENNQTFLKKTFEMMCGMVSKDMRRKDHADKMYLLRPHIQNLLKHVEGTNLLQKGEDLVLMKALASHLYETVAAIMLTESETLRENSEKYFRKALLNLLGDELVEFIFENDSLDHLQDISKLIVDTLEKYQDKIFPLLKQYTSNLDISSIKNDLSKCGSDYKSNVTRMKEALKKTETNAEVIDELKKFDYFLPDEKYSPIFYSERTAQILHSWSRVVTYGDKTSSPNRKPLEWYKCLSQLSTHISKQCNEKFEVPLLCEWLSSKKVYTSILLKEKKASNYSEALQICKGALSTTRENTNMYENGFLRNAFEPSYQSTRLYFLRTMVRIYARMIKEKQDDERFLMEGDNVCHELVNCSTEVSDANSVMRLIYCAKYYAARKQFDKAMECFDWYFNSLKNNPKCKPKFNVHCWAVYNYARAANCFPPYEKADDAKKKCEELLKREEERPTEDLTKLLDKSKKELQQKVLFADRLQKFRANLNQ